MIKEIEIPIGEEFNSESYPSPGLYIVNNTQLYCVAISAYYIGNTTDPEVKELISNCSNNTTSNNTTSNIDDILKVIAVSQQPELIKDV